MITSEEFDKKQFYQPAVDTISLILGLPACIWLADETRSALKIVAATGLSDEYIRKAGLRLDEPGVASEVFKTGKTTVVPDIASDDRWKYRSEAAAMGLKSAIVAPLQVEGKIVGAFDVYTHGVREFSDFEKVLIEKLAAQMVTSAIRNTQFFEQATNRAEALQKLHQIGGQVLSAEFSAQGLEKVLRQVAQSAKDVLDADLVDVYRYVEAENRWVLPPVLEGKRIGPEVVKNEIFEDDVVVQVVKDGKPIYTADAQDDPLFSGPYAKERLEHPEKRFVVREEILSSAAVSLRAADETVGVMFVNYRKRRIFSPDQREIIELFANQAALAIYNARVYERTQARLQERVDDIGALQDIYALIGIASLEDVLEQIAEESAHLTPAKYTGVWLVDERAHELRFGVMNERELAPTQDWSKISLDEDSINTHVVQTGRSYRCDDVKKDQYYQMWYEDVRSELTVPLKYGERVIGTLNLESTQIGAFTDDHVRLVEALAEAAAVAIHRARLYKAIRTVNEVGQALTGGIRLHENEILKLIRNKASELMDTDNMYIALYDEATDIVRFGLAFVNGMRVDVATEDGWQPRWAGKGRTEEIIRTRKPIFTATKAEAEAWYTQPEHKEYIGMPFASWIGVPMMVGEKVLGVIATYHPTRDHVYSKDDLGVLQSLASQAAIALDNARLYYDVNPSLEALVEFGRAVTLGMRLSEDEILDLIREQASQVMDTDNMYIALYDEPTDTLRFEMAFVSGMKKVWPPRTAGKGRTEWIIRNRKPVFMTTLAEGKAWYKQPGRQEYTGGDILPSWMGVPMMVGEKVLGVIAVYHTTQDYAYSGEDLEVLQAMASQAAIALENARLYEEARNEVIVTKQLATLGTVMAALQHRINNTFNIIVPNVSRLRKRVDMTDTTIVEILDIIERNARYTSDIIKSIQEPLRASEAQEINVNAVLNEVMSELREFRLVDSTQSLILITVDLDESIPHIQASSAQIAEVFRNLMNNACRVMKEGGQLTITSQLDDGKICVRVQDTGPGIPPRIQQRLFNQPVPSKEPGEGAGLGLWLSRLMLQSIGGDVTIEETSSTGTTMLVQIPTPGAGFERGHVRL